jgi:hypothetical protein
MSNTPTKSFVIPGNFVPIRRGVLDHLKKRKLTDVEFAAFIAIVLLADKATGAWDGCAAALADAMGKVVSASSERAAQRLLASLAKKGYLKNFRAQGQRHNQPILINRYLITVGELKGQLVDASNSTDWQKPAVFSGTEDGSEISSDGGTEISSDRDALSIPIETFSKADQEIDRKIDVALAPVVESKIESDVHTEPKLGSKPAEKLTKDLFQLAGQPKSLMRLAPLMISKAGELFKASSGYTYDELAPILRSALTGKLDTDKWSWKNVILTASNPMAMFVAKIDSIIQAYSALERRKALDSQPKPTTSTTNQSSGSNPWGATNVLF